MNKLLVAFLLSFTILGLFGSYTVFAQSDDALNFHGKGVVTGEHFKGGVMWTGINGDKATVIAQWDLGRSKIISDIISSSDCEPNYGICANATVTSSDNGAAVKVGDKFQIKIDTENKKQVIVGKFGFLENVEIVLDLNKIYKNPTVTNVSTFKDTRPNILLIILDDTGFSDLSITGSEIPTPAIDSLMSDGTLLTNYHVQPVCSPTRAELLTGVDHHLNGLGSMSEAIVPNQVGKPGYETYLNYNVVTIADLLKDAGYHTILSGKWHLGLEHPYQPIDRGFEESFSLLEAAANHFSERPFTYNENATYVLNGEQVHLPSDFYSSDNYADYMIDTIDKYHGDGKPQFMYLSFTATHDPLQAPQEYIKKWEGKYDVGYEKIREIRHQIQIERGIIPENTPLIPLELNTPSWDSLNATEKKIEAKKMVIFAAMLDNMDHNIGRVIDHLKEIGEYDNTLIYLASDNGPFAVSVEDLAAFKPGDDPAKFRAYMDTFDNSVENMGNENSFVSIGPGWAQTGATPLFGFKTTTSEGGMLVPAIIKIPNQPQEVKTNAFATVQDIAPTVLDYANVIHPKSSYKGHFVYSMDGKSLRPLLDGKVQIIHQPDEPFATEIFDNAAVYLGDWKLVKNNPPYDDSNWKLYNLAEDPTESNDLSKENSDLLTKMMGYYDDYVKRVGVIAPSSGIPVLNGSFN
jgi:arylsulfatase A-like enzyme